MVSAPRRLRRSTVRPPPPFPNLSASPLDSAPSPCMGRPGRARSRPRPRPAPSAHQVIGPGRSRSANMSATITASIANGTASNRTRARRQIRPRRPPQLVDREPLIEPPVRPARPKVGVRAGQEWRPIVRRAAAPDKSWSFLGRKSPIAPPENAGWRWPQWPGTLQSEAQPTGGLFVWRSGRRRLAASSGAATRGGQAFFPGAMRLLARQQSRRRRLTPWRVRRRSAPAS